MRVFVTVAALAAIAWLATLALDRTVTHTRVDIPLDPSRPRPQGGTYRCPVDPPDTLNPFRAMHGVARRLVLSFTHDALLDHDPATGALRPALASGLPALHFDGATPILTFELRDGLRFSDGSPLTMADVEFTAVAGHDRSGGEIAEATSNVTRFEALDGRRFALHLKRYEFTARDTIATQFRVVQKSWFLARAAEVCLARGIETPAPGSAAFAELLDEIEMPGPGTGPYRIAPEQDRWPLGDDLFLVQNAHCWRRDVYPNAWNLGAIQLRFDAALTRPIAAINQEIDYLAGSHDFDALLEEHPTLAEHYALHTYDNLRQPVLLIVWSCQRPPFDRPAVRRALTMAFDREQIRDAIFGGHARVPVSWFRPGSPNTAPELEPLPHDPAAVRRILADEGLENPTVTIHAPAGYEQLTRPLELAVDSFRECGIELDIRVEAPQAMVARLYGGDFTGGIIWYVYHTPTIDPARHFHSANTREFGGYANPALDALLDAAATEPNEAIRRETFHEISRVLAREQPVSLLAYPRTRLLLHRRFRNVSVGPLGLVPENWWVE